MPKAIITDIEGTISSISFVKEVLFPYSQKHLKDFILNNFEKDHRILPIIEATIEEVKLGNVTNIRYDLSCSNTIFETQVYTAIQALLTWIKEDKKITPLKDIQGLIWEEGFKQGVFKAPLYQDAFEFLLDSKGKGMPIYVYSSGSLHAQKLFFEFSEFGDIRYLFSGFFDTKIGSKKDPESYLKISETINIKPEHILFLTDLEDECIASEKAGLLTIQVVRDSQTFTRENDENTEVVIRQQCHSFTELSEIL